MKVRVERDPLGEVRVPADALYGAQTQRAVENFPISGLTAPPELVTATVHIKKAAAEANASLGRLDRKIADAIIAAADAILEGQYRDQFVVDIYQAGAGTSHNMNTNEVLANLAEERLGGRRGDLQARAPERSRQHGPVHQRRVSRPPLGSRCWTRWPTLSSAADGLAAALEAKARRVRARPEDRPHPPAGRGADHARPGVQRLRRQPASRAPPMSNGPPPQLHELNLGSTALGTGLNAGDDYTDARHLAPRRGNRPAAASGREPLPRHPEHGRCARLLRRPCAGWRWRSGKIASDLRLLSMGPRAGIAEIQLPAGATRLLDHARQGQSVGPRDGQPGLLPGDRLRRRDPGGRRRRPARTQRDDAGHRLERAARDPHPRQRDARLRNPLRRRHPRRRSALPRAARSQHRHRHGPQSLHRVR